MESSCASRAGALCLAMAVMVTILPSGSASSCEYQIFTPSSRYDGYIMSPNYPWPYSPGLCLMWVYYGKPGTFISIRILDIDMPSDSDECRNDFLTIGPLNQHTYCGSIDKQTFEPYRSELTSSHYWLFVIFNSTSFGSKGRGFKLYYQLFRSTPDEVTEIVKDSTTTVKDSTTTMTDPATTVKDPSAETPVYRFTDKCTFQLSVLSGEIRSDSVINTVHSAGYCSWLLYNQATDGYQVVYRLTFERFHLSEKSIFKIYDGTNMSATSLGTYSAQMPVFSLTSSSNSVFILYGPAIRFGAVLATDVFTVKYSAVVKCPMGYTACGYGEFSCYRELNRCDGVWHCPLHGGDERGCVAECPTDFSCDFRSSNCYKESDRCNGKGTCSNYMDELGCDEDRCSPDKGLYLCRNGRCIYEKWRCDHMNDCLDNSDEEDCSALSSPRVIVAAVIGSLLCALLLVVAMGCVCKVYYMRVQQLRGCSSHETPLSRQIAELFHHRAPPPPYHEAMLTSRPYDEAYLELLGQTEHRLESLSASSVQADNPTPVRDGTRSNHRGSHRRSRQNQRHQGQGHSHSSRSRPDSGRSVEAETLPLLLEAFEDGMDEHSSPSGNLASITEPPPYSQGDPYLRSENYCSDSDAASSENETWPEGSENVGYNGDEVSHTSLDTEAAVQMALIPSAAIWRPGDLTPVGSEVTIDDANDEDDGYKDADNASLSVDSSRSATEDDSDKTPQQTNVIDEDSDCECILSGNSAGDGVDTDSDTVCILGHT